MEQTFIAIFKNARGEMVDFERFTYKRLNTVVKAISTLLEGSLYKVCCKMDGAEYIDIYQTADEWRGTKSVATISIAY